MLTFILGSQQGSVTMASIIYSLAGDVMTSPMALLRCEEMMCCLGPRSECHVEMRTAPHDLNGTRVLARRNMKHK